MKILIIGGAGFLGTKLTRSCLDNNHEVTIYDNFSKSNLTVVPLEAKVINDDICNVANHREQMESFDVIYYLAQPRLGEINDDIKLQAVNNLGATIENSSPEVKLIFASSCSVYGVSDDTVNEESEVQITSPYSAMKIECEELIKKYDRDNYKILRLSTLFGIGRVTRPDLMVNNFILDILNDEIDVFDPEAIRPHFLVDDAAVALRVLGEIDFNETILNLGHKDLVFSKTQLIDKISSAFKKKPKVNIYDTKDSRSYLVDFYKFDNITNFHPTKFKNAIKPLYKLKERINASLESYDNLTKYYLPNTASKTWYVNEEGQFGLPKTWGWWNIVDEDFNLFDTRIHRTLVTPDNFNPADITYLTTEQAKNKKHLYIVHAFNGDYFKINKHIGLRCVDEQYIEHLRSGQAKLVFICTLEGYSGEENNKDFETIQSWIDQMNIPGENVYYITGNLIAPQVGRTKGVTFNLVPVCMFDSWMPLNTVNLKDKVTFNPIDSKYLYLSYARNPRDQRIALCTKLLKKDLIKKGRVSLGKFKYAKNLNYIDTPENIKKLSEITPIEIDRTLQYNLAADLTLQDYEHTFISIVNETLTTKDTLFLSEKIFKPILVGHPFVVIGNVGTLKYLKDLGYRTFDQWIDESYDEEPDFLKRVDKAVKVLEDLRYYSLEDLKHMREQMQEVLDWNKHHFIQSLKLKYGLEKDFAFIEEPMKPIKTELVKIYNTISYE